MSDKDYRKVQFPPELPQQMRSILHYNYRASKSPLCPRITMRQGAALLFYIEGIEADLAALREENARLRGVCAEAYQMAGFYDAPVEALDNLSAAANGMELPHETFLPIIGVPAAERESVPDAAPKEPK